jgi:Phosphotransferase enzyme family
MARWVPEPAWQAVTGAGGSATRGVWRAERDGRPCIVKRLEPAENQAVGVRHHSWWQREAEVATSGILNGLKGLVAPTSIAVDEDEDGVSLWSLELPTASLAGDVLANAYGRFSSQSVQDPGWFTRGMLRHRIAATDAVGGLRPLRESGLIDDALLRTSAALWSVRLSTLDALDKLPLVLSHGDALPRNMLCLDGEDVIAVDWGQLGYNTVGSDLATLCLYSTEDLAELIRPYREGLTESGRPVDESTVRRATVQIAALIAMSRASRAVASGSDTDAYLGRLVRAEPILNEAVATPARR